MYKLYPKTKEEAERISEDYRFLGYNTSIKDGVLSVWWGNKRVKKVKEEKPEKPERNKRLDRRSSD